MSVLTTQTLKSELESAQKTNLELESSSAELKKQIENFQNQVANLTSELDVKIKALEDLETKHKGTPFITISYFQIWKYIPKFNGKLSQKKSKNKSLKFTLSPSK